MKKIISLCLSTLCLFASCDKGNDPNKKYEITSMRLEIANAKMLATCGDNATKAGDASLDLFKIDKDGNMTAVRCWTSEDNGQQTETTVKLVPEVIVPLNDEYVIFSNINVYDGGTRVLSLYSENYLIRKRDGAIFRIGWEEFPSMFSNYDDLIGRGINTTPRMDEQANVYCLAGGGYPTDIYKLTLSNPDNLTFQKITLPQFPLESYGITPFEVDKNGNCIASVSQENQKAKMGAV